MRIHPPQPKWTYENPEGESELSRRLEEQEREASKIDLIQEIFFL
jgi:hypothetical protein